jgi:ABC-2 type transport system ATP-binding protein
VIAEGTPEELKSQLGATVLEVGLATIEDADRTGEILRVLGSHTPVVSGTVVEVTVDRGPEAAMAGLRALDQSGIVPTSFTLREPSLDDVFISLTGHAAEGERIELDDEEDASRGRARRKAAHESMPIATGGLS